MKFINYIVVHISIVLGLGIITAHFVSFSNFFVIQIIIVLSLIFVIVWILCRNQLSQNSFFGFFAYLCFFGIGYFNYQIRLPKFQADHYSHFSSEEIPASLQLKAINILKSDAYNDKYIVKVQALNGKLTKGKILLIIQNDSLPLTLEIDDIILVRTSTKSIPKPLNPNQFDYSKYMAKLGVYHQSYVSRKQIMKIGKGKITLIGSAEGFRSMLIKKLKATNLKSNERAIVQALVLGQKKDISKELYTDYAAAGAVHILAVSGLHVGILLLIFSALFRPLHRLKYGEYIHAVLLLFCLWIFAFIAGLSPSVTRAVVMFSFFIFAKIINRQTSTINNLFLSFFVLLIYNPLWIFHVGFQLSYLAVLSILLIQPKLKNLYRPKYYLDKILWDIFTVSLTAQIGIIPLSLFYFHQFPGLFFITNIVVLPVLGILLGGGLFVVLLAGLELLPDWLGLTYNYLIQKLNSFIVWVANQDIFIVQDIHFSALHTIGSYLFLISVLFLLYDLNYRKLIVTIIGFCLLLGVFVYKKYETADNRLVIFHKNRKTIMGYKQSQKLVFFQQDSVGSNNVDYAIKSYGVSNGIRSYSYQKIPKIFRFRNKSILVLGSLGIFPKNNKIDILVLTQSPKVHLERLIESIQPKLIVADGSNYWSYISRWEKTCSQKKLPFHHTGTKGALIIE